MPALNFPPVYIEDAVLSPVTRYTRRVDIYESNATTLWKRGVPLVSGSISVDQSRDERRSGSLVLFNDNGLLNISRSNGFWYDKVVKIYMGVVSPSGTWEAIVGTFLIDKISSENYSKEIEVTLRDFSKKLSYPISLPVGWAVNTPIENIVRDLAIGGGISPSKITVPTTTKYIEEERTFASGITRWSAMYDLATAYGYDLFFDPSGQLIMEAFTDPFTSLPQFTFRVGIDSNVSKISRAISDSLIRNHIVVEGETVGGIPVWGEAFNYNPTSPTRIEKLGFRTKQIKNSWVTNNTQATEVAARDLKFSSLEKYEASLETLIVPWLDVNITVEFSDPMAAPGDPTRFLLSKLDLDLGLEPASASLGRVTSVFVDSVLYPNTTIYPSSETFPG